MVDCAAFELNEIGSNIHLDPMCLSILDSGNLEDEIRINGFTPWCGNILTRFGNVLHLCGTWGDLGLDSSRSCRIQKLKVAHWPRFLYVKNGLADILIGRYFGIWCQKRR